MSYIVSISNIGKYTSFKIIHKFQSSEFEYIIIFVGGKFAWIDIFDEKETTLNNF